MGDQSNPSKPSNSTNSIAQLFDGLSLEKSHSSPANCSVHEMTPSNLSSSSNDPPENSTKSNDHEAEVEKKRIMNNNCLYLGKSPANDNTNRFFPPPISSLKLVKKGIPVVYIECNQDENRFTSNKVRVPAGDMLVASRESGRLKLYFAHEIVDNEDDGDGGRGC